MLICMYTKGPRVLFAKGSALHTRVTDIRTRYKATTGTGTGSTGSFSAYGYYPTRIIGFCPTYHGTAIRL